MSRTNLEGDVERLRAGDRRALERIYDATYRAVFYAIYYILKDRAATEEILQDTYFAAYRKLDRFHGGNFTGWLVTIGRNLAINEYQKRKREIATDFQENESLYGAYRVDDRTETPLLDLAGSILNEEEYRILSLCAIAGYKRREVAKMLGIPIGTVTWRYHEAIKKLKAQLERGANEQ